MPRGVVFCSLNPRADPAPRMTLGLAWRPAASPKPVFGRFCQSGNLTEQVLHGARGARWGWRGQRRTSTWWRMRSR